MKLQLTRVLVDAATLVDVSRRLQRLVETLEADLLTLDQVLEREERGVRLVWRLQVRKQLEKFHCACSCFDCVLL